MKEDFIKISVIGKQGGPKSVKLGIEIARACHIRILDEQEANTITERSSEQ